MIRDDDWVQVAMENDVVVVELLIQLHQSASPPPLDTWSVRQPRSKPLSLNNNKKNQTPPPPPPLSTRSSPTTPLSWMSQSGSGSAEDSSRRPSTPTKRPDAPRSKVSGMITSKRPRKKKTLVELKEEEMLLMKEKRHLKRELDSLRLNLEKQRAINQDFKRLKIDKQATAITHNEMIQNGVFSLPDLNIAVEEDL